MFLISRSPGRGGPQGSDATTALSEDRYRGARLGLDLDRKVLQIG